MSEWQTVVFDLDDTLFPERDYVISGFKAVAAWAEAHLRIPAEQGWAELRTLFETGVRGDTFDRWLLMHRVSRDGLVPYLVQIYRAHIPTLQPFPDVPRVLHHLRKDYRLGLLSDGYLAVQQCKLVALGLANRFDAIVFCGELGREHWKPSIKPFQVIVKRLGVEPSRTVYVGDNPNKDFLGAKAAGMFSIRVRHPEGLHADLEPPTSDHAPHFEIANLTQLRTALLNART